MGNITSDLNKIGFRKERNNASAAYIAAYTSAYRVGFGGVQATPVAIPVTDCLGWDKPDGELEIPEPLRKKEELNVIGDGPKTADVVEMGYETVEQAITVNAQTGIWLYYVMGGYSCDGTDLSSPITQAAVTKVSVLVMGGFSGLVVNAHVGRIVRQTSAGATQYWCWTIVSNTATELTLNSPIPDDVATEDVEILMAPFTHTITEPSTTATQVASNSQVYLPSFIIHFEQSDGTNIEYRDLIGCLVKSLKITLEKGAKVMYEVTVLVPKSMVGLVQTAYPTYALSGDATRAALSYPTDEIFGWYDFDLAESYLTYNSVAVFGSTQNWFNELGKLEITISHELEILPIQGDPYPYKVLNGKLDYEVLMTYYPNSNEDQDPTTFTTYRLLKSLKRMKLAEYTTNLAMRVRLQRSATDYVQLTFSSLYVTEFPDKLTTIEEKQVSIDVTMRNAPAKGSVTAGSLAVVVVDDRNPSYYGDT